MKGSEVDISPKHDVMVSFSLLKCYIKNLLKTLGSLQFLIDKSQKTDYSFLRTVAIENIHQASKNSISYLWFVEDCSDGNENLLFNN